MPHHARESEASEAGRRCGNIEGPASVGRGTSGCTADGPRPVFLTVAEVGDVLRCSRQQVMRLIAWGDLRGAIRVGRAVRVPERELRRYLADAEIAPAGESDEAWRVAR